MTAQISVDVLRDTYWSPLKHFCVFISAKDVLEEREVTADQQTSTLNQKIVSEKKKAYTKNVLCTHCGFGMILN